MGQKRRRDELEDEDEDYTNTSVKKQRQHVPETPLPEGVHHYQDLKEVPWDLQKYWHQGYAIFSRYDDGIWMTDDAWYGVTHECIANKIAQDMADSAPPDRSIIIDAFCGVGGNTIAFALSGRWKRVYAIEKDSATLACAKHNAEIYGVADQITWFHGDCFEIFGLDEKNQHNAVGALKAVVAQYGVIFASPPWGGPGYKSSQVFDLETMEPYSFSYLHRSFGKVTPNMVLYLPRTSNLNQIAHSAEDDKKTQVIHYCTKRNSRALCVYLGNWSIIGL